MARGGDSPTGFHVLFPYQRCALLQALCHGRVLDGRSNCSSSTSSKGRSLARHWLTNAWAIGRVHGAQITTPGSRQETGRGEQQKCSHAPQVAACSAGSQSSWRAGAASDSGKGLPSVCLLQPQGKSLLQAATLGSFLKSFPRLQLCQ